MTTRHGWSLIELLMVVAIVAALVGIALPRYGTSADRYRAEAVTRRVVAELLYARSLARAESRRVIVQFDLGRDTIKIKDLPDPRNPDIDYTVRLEDPPYRAQLVSVSFDGRKECAFNASGMLVKHESGKPFEADGTIVIAVDGAEQVVTVPIATGRASVE